MSSLSSLLLALPAWLVLLVAFVLPAAEASTFVGVVIPGETAVLVAGLLAHEGRLPLAAVMAAAAAGAIAGDQVGFLLGRRYGPALLDRLPAWVARRTRPDRVLDVVRRRGVLAVVLGRWTASLRALVPGFAGLSGMPRLGFTLANAVGGAAWGAGVAMVGYLAGASLSQLESWLSLGGTGLAAVGAVLVIVLVRRRRRKPLTQRPPEVRDPHFLPTARSAT